MNPQQFVNDHIDIQNASYRHAFEKDKKAKLLANAEYLKLNFDSNQGQVLLPGDRGFQKISNIEESTLHKMGLQWNKIFQILAKPMADKPAMYGITYEMHREPPKTDKLHFLVGRIFEEIPASEIPKFDLGISNMGILNYSKNLSETLARIFVRMNIGAKMFVYGDRHQINVDDSSGLSRSVGLAGGSSVRTNSAQSFDNIKIKDWIKKYVKGITIIELENNVWIMERNEQDLLLPELQFVSDLDPDHPYPPSYLFSSTGRWIHPVVR